MTIPLIFCELECGIAFELLSEHGPLLSVPGSVV
jgi:hypothetical protein